MYLILQSAAWVFFLLLLLYKSVLKYVGNTRLRKVLYKIQEAKEFSFMHPTNFNASCKILVYFTWRFWRRYFPLRNFHK